MQSSGLQGSRICSSGFAFCAAVLLCCTAPVALCRRGSTVLFCLTVCSELQGPDLQSSESERKAEGNMQSKLLCDIALSIFMRARRSFVSNSLSTRLDMNAFVRQVGTKGATE